jgi:hypothetical protein
MACPEKSQDGGSFGAFGPAQGARAGGGMFRVMLHAPRGEHSGFNPCFNGCPSSRFRVVWHISVA